MDVLKLGFADTFEGAKTFFTDVFSKKYFVVRDDENPDYLIFGDKNFGNSNERFNDKNVVKIFFTGENERPWDYHCHFSMAFDHIDDNRNFRFPHYVIYEYDHHILGRHKRTKDDVIPEKFCSFIQKNPNAPKRNFYFEQLSRYKRVDAAGPLFNNMEDGWRPDSVTGKVDFMSEYKFNLCFENATYPGYLTERLFEALCAKTIPIYWGSATAAMEFNPKAFLSWHEYQDDQAFVNAIIELDRNPDKYMEMYLQPMFNNGDRKNKYFDVYRILDWFERNVYRGQINGQ
jgi:hypothetical protein